MSAEYFTARQMGKEGNLGPMSEICVVAAQRVYLERKYGDTNPRIVQMILHGEKIPHWYYRSDQHVEQPYFIPPLVQPYVGRSDFAMPILYGYGTYVVDQELMDDTDAGITIEGMMRMTEKAEADEEENDWESY